MVIEQNILSTKLSKTSWVEVCFDNDSACNWLNSLFQLGMAYDLKLDTFDLNKNIFHTSEFSDNP